MEKKNNNVKGKQLYNSNLKKCTPGKPSFQPKPNKIKHKIKSFSIVKQESSLKFKVPKYVHNNNIPKLKKRVIKNEFKRYNIRKCL